MALYFDKLDLSKRLLLAGFTADQADCLAIELHGLMETCLNEASRNSLVQPPRRASVVLERASNRPKAGYRQQYFDKLAVSHRFEENGFSHEQSDCLAIEFHELMTRVLDEVKPVQSIQTSELDRFELALKGAFGVRDDKNAKRPDRMSDRGVRLGWLRRVLHGRHLLDG